MRYGKPLRHETTTTVVLNIDFVAAARYSPAATNRRSARHASQLRKDFAPDFIDSFDSHEARCGEGTRSQRRAIVVDTHNDITTPMTNDDFDLGGNPPTPYRTNIERMKKGGLSAIFFSLYIKPSYVQHGGAARRTLDMIDAVYRAAERHPNDLMLANSSADIRRAKSQYKIACLMGIEGGHAIENSLPTLREFYRLGACVT